MRNLEGRLDTTRIHFLAEVSGQRDSGSASQSRGTREPGSPHFAPVWRHMEELEFAIGVGVVHWLWNWPSSAHIRTVLEADNGLEILSWELQMSEHRLKITNIH